MAPKSVSPKIIAIIAMFLVVFEVVAGGGSEVGMTLAFNMSFSRLESSAVS